MEALQRVYNEVCAVVAPPPDLTVSEWADTYAYLSSESSAEPGRWRTSRAEYQRGMMDSITDPDIYWVVFKTSAQIGKTVIILHALGYFIHQDPSPILFALPTDKLAEAISKDRLAPMLRDTPILRALISDPKSRDSSNTLLSKRFPGGNLTMVGSNSPANVSSRPIRVFLEDEKDRFAKSAGTEGNVSSLGWARTKNFYNRKRISTSTPTEKNFSAIEDDWEKSDQREYYVPCPHCETQQTLKWANVRWDKEEDETGQKVHLPETARMVCEFCEREIDESARTKMLATGEWIAGRKSRGIAGFHINELYSPWRHWWETVTEFLESKDDPEKLKVWTNTALGEVWEIIEEKREPAGLFARREDYGAEAPNEALLVTAGVDVQKDRWEITYTAWTSHAQSWVLAHEVIEGDTAIESQWDNKLDPALMRQFKTQDGRSLAVACAFIDAGFRTSLVYRFTKARSARRIYACHGKDGTEKNVIHQFGKPKRGKGERPEVAIVGVDTAKDQLFAYLNAEKPGPGYCHFPLSADMYYFEQLTAEVVKMKRRFGRPVRYYELLPGRRNEALDCWVYAYAAMSFLRVDWEKMKPKSKPAQARQPQRAGGYVGGWKRGRRR